MFGDLSTPSFANLHIYDFHFLQCKSSFLDIDLYYIIILEIPMKVMSSLDALYSHNKCLDIPHTYTVLVLQTKLYTVLYTVLYTFMYTVLYLELHPEVNVAE